MRKLASIQKVLEINDIAGADNIQQIRVLGWNLIAKKGEFSAGDLCCYIEIDSKLPEKPWSEFLRPRGFKVKTMKLNKFKVISQGLALPLSFFPEIKNPKEGQDVTDLLGVIKYESDDDSSYSSGKAKKINPVVSFLFRYFLFRAVYLKFFGKRKESWPEFIVKTDETRIQNLSLSYERFKEMGEWYFTEKCEGQSLTVFTKTSGFFKKKEFGVCSRNIWLKTEHACNWWNVAKKLDLEEKLRMLSFDMMIQGEIIGPGIQGNIYKLDELELRVFNVKNLSLNYNYTVAEVRDFCATVGLKPVPLLFKQELPETLNQLVELSNGQSSIHPTLREGLVIRHSDGISFKVVSPEYLLKHGK